MRVYYDTEFLEDGSTIELISLGMVREDGKELYLINREMPLARIQKHSWLMQNVMTQLPMRFGNHPFDPEHPDYKFVKSRNEIRTEVGKFLADTPNLELWAWYASYDHIALAQIFGRMLDLPNGVPMWTNDLRQELHRLGNPRYPEQASGAHNALEDAKWNKLLGDYLQKLDGPIERR